MHPQNSKNFYPGTRHWQPVIMKTTERLNLPPFSCNTVFNNNICKDEQRTSFSDIWTSQSSHNAHLFGKIGSVEVGIFKLNKTNNQTVIMADMFQNVNLQLWYSVQYYLSISVTQRISSFSCPSLAMYWTGSRAFLVWSIELALVVRVCTFVNWKQKQFGWNLFVRWPRFLGL